MWVGVVFLALLDQDVDGGLLIKYCSKKGRIGLKLGTGLDQLWESGKEGMWGLHFVIVYAKVFW